jgi:hypothetical protein
MAFVKYREFNDPDSADTLADMLITNEIAFEVAQDRDSLDSLYGDRHQRHRFYIKLKQQDFAKADSILLNESKKQLDTVGADHYLFSFTDEELFEILAKHDEWNEFDYVLAQKVLKDRGKDINSETTEMLKKQRIRDLGKKEEGQRSWIYAGYLFALLGGLLGIFIGWHLSSFKKTLPNGQQIHSYTARDRRHGRRIMIISIVMLVVSLTFRIAAMADQGGGIPGLFVNL